MLNESTSDQLNWMSQVLGELKLGESREYRFSLSFFVCLCFCFCFFNRESILFHNHDYHTLNFINIEFYLINMNCFNAINC